MTQNENDLQQGDKTGLENLPESERKETQEIIDEIAADEKKSDPQPKPEETPKPKEGETPSTEKKPDETPKPKEGEGELGKKSEDQEPSRKPGKLMPAWVHETAKKDWETEKAALEAKITELSTPNPGEDKPATEAKPVTQATIDKVEEFAKANNLAPEVVKGILDLAAENSGKIPQEISDQLKKLDEITREKEVQAEEQAYSSNFDKYVLPLIKKEYGAEVGQDTVDEIKEQLKAKAYTEEYKSTPYSVIYKGIDDFRKFTRPAGSTAEGSRGGAHNAPGGDEGGAQGNAYNGKPFSELSEDDIGKLPGDVFDKYSAWLEGEERARRGS